MNIFKKSKDNFNKEYLSNKKCYYVFTFFNVNPTVVDLIRMVIEDDYGLKISRIEKKYNLMNLFLEFNLKDYFEYKTDLSDFFMNENFKFCLNAIYYNNNYLEPSFFEDEFLNEFDEYELHDELIFYIYLKLLINVIEEKKFFFFMYNLIIMNKNLFLYNVYNTSSSL